MSDMDEELDRLNDLLNQIPVEREGMRLVEFDGYVAALIVCPEMILPSEWLPPVWGVDGVFEHIGAAEDIVGAVMGHYNRVAQALAEDPEAYAPVLQIDPTRRQVGTRQLLARSEEGRRARGLERDRSSTAPSAASTVERHHHPAQSRCSPVKM